MRIQLVASFLILAFVWPAQAQQRCQNYKQEVRRYHYEVFGVDFPWWYAVGQLQQESGCRNVISNDGVGSQGLPQITWLVWKKHLEKQGIHNLKSTASQLRAQAVINKNTWNQSPIGKLWVSYQIYNGGRLVLKEISRAGSDEWQDARNECHRRIISFSNGMRIDACDINYDYSQKIFKYGNQYRTEEDNEKFKYW